jgi:hypothetical protein
VARENPVLDQSRDLDGRELYRLTHLYQAPDWVKSASVTEICGNEIPDHMYADSSTHLYPLHTKAATWASAAFFADKQAHLSHGRAELVRDRILKAASFLGIRADVETLFKRAEELGRHSDSSLPDEAFAYIGVGPNGQRERRLRLINSLEVKAAAEWLHRYRDQLEFPERKKIAEKVLQKAAEFGASVGELDEFLERSAGFGGCSCREAVAAVQQRAKLARARHPDAADALEKLAAHLAAVPEETRQLPTLQKLAHTLEIADRMLNVAYDGPVRRPEDILFSITRKAASTFTATHIPMPSGAVYHQDDLSRLRVQQVREHLGDEVADNITSDGLTVDPEKLAEILPTMTRGDAEIFDRMARAAGVPMRFKEAAARRQGLTQADILQFAAAHRPQ